jgi:CRP/FNR family transcriptional regulator, cyclic AMP receptor protein
VKWELLDGLAEAEVQALLGIAGRRSFARGEVVFREHDPVDALHLVEEGRFSVRVATPVGGSAIAAILGPGDLFGELALVSDAGDRRLATVAALEPGATLAVHRRDFARLREEHPEMATVLVAILAEQVRVLSRHLLEALYVPADQRVLRRLLELGELYARPDGETVVPLTQEDIAGLAGTSRATVNRVLRDEEARGTVRLRRGRTAVVDRDELRRRGGL